MLFDYGSALNASRSALPVSARQLKWTPRSRQYYGVEFKGVTDHPQQNGASLGLFLFLSALL